MSTKIKELISQSIGKLNLKEEYILEYQNFVEAEFDDYDDEEDANKISPLQIDNFVHRFHELYQSQISKGYSQEWARCYCVDIIWGGEDYVEGKMPTDYNPKLDDAIIFVKSLNKDDIFKYAFIEAVKGDYLCSHDEDLYYFAERYQEQYMELVKHGHSDTYAKAYLMSIDYEDVYIVPSTIYAHTYEVAMNNGMSFDMAYDFAGDVCYHFADIFEVPKYSEKYIREYRAKWQQPLVLEGFAYAMAKYMEVINVDDFVEIVMSNSNIVDMAEWTHEDWRKYYRLICEKYFNKYADETPEHFEEDNFF